MKPQHTRVSLGKSFARPSTNEQRVYIAESDPRQAKPDDVPPNTGAVIVNSLGSTWIRDPEVGWYKAHGGREQP